MTFLWLCFMHKGMFKMASSVKIFYAVNVLLNGDDDELLAGALE